tara:strand:- start:17 stop:274 length:258 start_codon:yes stop_codon:yes gene_type:complete
MKHDKIVNAVLKINPNAKFILKGETIEWLEGTSPITNADIEAMIPIVEAEYKEKETARKNLKASAKAKLIAGQPLTEEEADTIVL